MWGLNMLNHAILEDSFGHRYAFLEYNFRKLPKSLTPLRFYSLEKAKIFVASIRNEGRCRLLKFGRFSHIKRRGGGKYLSDVEQIALALYCKRITVFSFPFIDLGASPPLDRTIAPVGGYLYRIEPAIYALMARQVEQKMFSNSEDAYDFIEKILPDDRTLHKVLNAVPNLSLPGDLQASSRASLISLLALALVAEILIIIVLHPNKKSQAVNLLVENLDRNAINPVRLAPEVTRRSEVLDFYGEKSERPDPLLRHLRQNVVTALDQDRDTVIGQLIKGGATVSAHPKNNKLFRVKQLSGVEMFLILDSAIPDFLRPVPVSSKVSELANLRPSFPDRDTSDPLELERAISSTKNINLQTHKKMSGQYLQEMNQLLGGKFDDFELIEKGAMLSELQQETGLRLIESLQPHKSALKSSGINSIASASGVSQILHNPSLPHSERMNQLHDLINHYEERGSIDLKETHIMIDNISDGVSEPQMRLGEDGIVYNGDSPISPMPSIIRNVQKTNQLYAANGVHREVVVGVTSQNKLMLLSRKTTVFQSKGIAVKLDSQVGDPLDGGFTVEIGAGSGAYSPNMVADVDRLGAPLVQTEYGPELLEPGLLRRDLQGWATQVGVASDPDTVVILADMLSLMPKVLGEGSTKKIIMNNISADPSSDDYDKIAQSLIAVMKNEGQIDLQWDIQPEDSFNTPRGHIMIDEGVTRESTISRRLFMSTRDLADGQVTPVPELVKTKGLSAALEQEMSRVGGRVDVKGIDPVEGFPYTIDVSKRSIGANAEDASKFSAPAPSSRAIFTIHKEQS